MSSYLPCDEYIGDEVVVSWYNSVTKLWVTEISMVSEDPYGQIPIQSAGPAAGQPYWVGKRFTSRIKTLPIRSPNELNDVKRLSKVHVYLDESHGGTITVGDEMEEESSEIIYEESGPFSGKISTVVDGGYAESPFIEIFTDSVYPFRLLALEMDLRKYK